MNEEEFIDAFPPPPPFYKLYINYNPIPNDEEEGKKEDSLHGGESSGNSSISDHSSNNKKETDGEEGSKTMTEQENETNDPLCVYSEALPPPKPVKGLFQMYGQIISTEGKMKRPADDNIKDLMRVKEEKIKERNETDFILQMQELKKMNRSLVFNYWELLNILLKYPTAKMIESEKFSLFDFSTVSEEQRKQITDYSLGQEKFAYELKIDQIKLLFLNMTYILNSYRAHQTREQLISVLKEQARRKQEAIRDIQKCVKDCKETLQKTMERVRPSDDVKDKSPDVSSNMKRNISDMMDVDDEYDEVSSSIATEAAETTNGKTNLTAEMTTKMLDEIANRVSKKQRLESERKDKIDDDNSTTIEITDSVQQIFESFHKEIQNIMI